VDFPTIYLPYCFSRYFLVSITMTCSHHILHVLLLKTPLGLIGNGGRGS
jgi:hypothetical protein